MKRSTRTARRDPAAEVGTVSDPENLAAAPAKEGGDAGEVAAAADAFSTQLGLGMFDRGHITA
jgi:hypothetical protein